MSRLPWRVLLVILVTCLALSIGASYVAVVSQNPHPPTQPLYGPSDFAR
jgi:hypothetical protein